MRVVSWNIKFGRNVDLAAGQLQALPELADADVVLLQEMDESGTKLIAEQLDADYAFAAAAPHRETGRPFGNAIVSRWPIADVVEIELPHVASVRGQPRSATHARLRIDGADIFVYSVHTEIPTMGYRKRREQVITLLDHVETLEADARVLVGGDFNTAARWDIGVLRSLMDTANFAAVSQRSGPTFGRFGRPFTLDHLFARGLRSTGSGAVTDATASDHLPVWAEVDPH